MLPSPICRTLSQATHAAPSHPNSYMLGGLASPLAAPGAASNAINPVVEADYREIFFNLAHSGRPVQHLLVLFVLFWKRRAGSSFERRNNCSPAGN